MNVGFYYRGCWIVAACCLALGCVPASYKYGRFHPYEPDGVKLEPVRIERGRPNPTLDKIGSVVGAPQKLLKLEKNVNNHKVSQQTLDQLTVYLEQNDLTDVFVAVNQYDPKQQWRLLRENRYVAPGWKYTVGTLAWVGYCLFPGRVFGGDYYNPYTNSLNINSDVPAVVLYEAALAKDLRARKFPGWYLAVNGLPLLALPRQCRAMGDVIAYSREQADWETERKVYNVLFAHVGAEAVTPGTFFIPALLSPLIHVGGAIAGHATGRLVAREQEKKWNRGQKFDADPRPADERVELADYAEEVPSRSRVTLIGHTALPAPAASPQRGRREARYEGRRVR